MAWQAAWARVAKPSCHHDIQELVSLVSRHLSQLDGQALSADIHYVEEVAIAPHRIRVPASLRSHSVAESLAEEPLSIRDATQPAGPPAALPLPQFESPPDLSSTSSRSRSKGSGAAPSSTSAISPVHELGHASTPEATDTTLHGRGSNSQSATQVSERKEGPFPSVSSDLALSPGLGGHQETHPDTTSMAGNIEPLFRGAKRSSPHAEDTSQPRRRKKLVAKKTNWAAVSDDSGGSDGGTNIPDVPETPKQKNKRGRPPKAPRQADGRLVPFRTMAASEHEARKVAAEALDRYDVYAVSDAIDRATLVNTVVQATRNAGGTELQCRRNANLFANLFSKQTASRVDDFLVRYSGDHNIVVSSRATEKDEPRTRQNVVARAHDSCSDPAGDKYRDFVAIAIECAKIGKRIKQDEFVLIDTCARLASRYSEICDELSSCSRDTVTHHHGAPSSEDQDEGRAEAQTQLPDALLNATLHFHAAPQAMELYRANRDQVHRYTDMGEGINALSSWGDGVRLFLYGIPWPSTLEHLNVHYVKVAMRALVRIDPLIEGIFTNFSAGISVRIAHGQPLDDAEVKQVHGVVAAVNDATASCPLVSAIQAQQDVNIDLCHPHHLVTPSPSAPSEENHVRVSEGSSPPDR